MYYIILNLIFIIITFEPNIWITELFTDGIRSSVDGPRFRRFYSAEGNIFRGVSIRDDKRSFILSSRLPILLTSNLTMKLINQ